jgi:hypothetical protein
VPSNGVCPHCFDITDNNDAYPRGFKWQILWHFVLFKVLVRRKDKGDDG